MNEQREELMKGCDVLIATPGRLKDFLRKPRLLSLHRIR
jgi:ATP-dependent RNA helicase DDX3X